MIDLSSVLILALAAWRLSSLIARESGPFGILDKFRFYAGVRYDKYSIRYGLNEFAKGIMCVWCSSVWLGILGAIGYFLNRELTLIIALPLAISGAALIVEGLVGMEEK